MFCILKKITRKSLNETTMLSKGLQKSEGMSHGEAGGIASLAEGTASTKTFRGKCARSCLRINKRANMAAAKSARRKQWEMRLERWRMGVIRGRKSQMMIRLF